jgi:hypothetical protein
MGKQLEEEGNSKLNVGHLCVFGDKVTEPVTYSRIAGKV